MALERSFITSLPPSDVWTWISDLEQLAGATPGLSLVAPDDSGLTGKLVLRVGAQQVTHTGQIVVTASDPAAGRLTLAATGAGARGSGEASAQVRIRLDEGADGTTVAVTVEPAGSGRIQTFDQDAVRASGERLLDRFVAAIQEGLPAAVSERVAGQEPVAAEPEPRVEPDRPTGRDPATEHLATVTSISDVIRDRSRARRSVAASAVAMVAAMLALWLVHRRNAH